MGEREYVIEQCLPNGDLQLQDIISNTYLAKSRNELVDALFNGHMAMIGDDAAKYVRKKAAGMLEADFSQFDGKDKAEAKRKYAYVTAICEKNLDRKTRKALQPLIKTVSKSINDEKPPSPISVYRWWRDFKASGENIRSLLSLRSQKGNRERRLSREVIDIINAVIGEMYLNPQRNSVQSAYDAVVARIHHENELRYRGDRMEIPKRLCIYRAIEKLDPYEVMKARYGKRLADLKFEPKGQGVRPTRPLERVEIDHTKLDLFVFDPERKLPIGRPWLTTAIDVYTKCIVGFYISFNPPSYLSVMHCMRHAIKPKTYVKKTYPEILNSWDAYGIMETVVADNGKEFYSHDFEDACLQLGVVIQYTPVKLAWYKPSIERYFRTLNMSLLHGQPGTTFSNIFDKGDYDPVKNAVIDMETLLEIVHTWIIDAYHQQFHRGIMEVPARLWERAIEEFPPALPCKNSELDVLLGMVDYRVLSAKGIELNGLFYNGDLLAALRRGNKTDGKKVKVKSDPSDLGVIHVLDEETKTFIAVRALNYKYAEGLTLWQHNVIRNFSLKQYGKADEVSVALAKDRIREIVEDYLYHSKRKGSHQKAARWLNMSQDNYGKIVDKNEADNKKKQVQSTYKAPLQLPMAKDRPANCIADIGEPVLTDSKAEAFKGIATAGHIITDVSLLPAKAKKRDSLLRRSKMKEGEKITDRTQSERNRAVLIQPAGECIDLDMTGYSASYSLPRRK